MDTKERLKSMIYYLMDIKNMESQGKEYNLRSNNFFWQRNLLIEGAIIKIKKNGSKYLEVNSQCTDIYSKFSKIYSKMLKEGSNLEIIWGYCFTTLKLKNIRMLYPLFLYKCQLKYCDSEKKYIVEPIDDKFKVEVEVLKNIGFNDISENLKVKSFIENNFKCTSRKEDIQKALSIIHKKSKLKILKKEKIKGDKVTFKELNITNEVSFYNEPVIVVRECRKDIWNDELSGILKRIEDDSYIPNTIKTLVEDIDFNYISNMQCENEQKDKLYALPYNKEQLSIGEQISNNFGVVVEGPPGTGKTYSIANLITHFLANDKKVLVTSAKYKSQENILRMIPNEVKSLCIDYNENPIKNLYKINIFVCNLIEKIQLSVSGMENNIKNIEFQLQCCRKNQSNLYDKITISKNIEQNKINYLGKKYTVAYIKKWLRKYKREYSWIEDEVNDIKKPPITDAKFSRLVYIMSNITKDDIYEVNNIGGLLYNIPPYYELLHKIKRKFELQRNYSEYKLAVKNWCISYNCNYDYDYILKELRKTQKFLADIENSWLKNIFHCVKGGKTVKGVLQQTILKCNYYIKKLGSIRKEIYGYEVKIPQDIELTNLLQILEMIYKQYDKKGKINKIFRIIHNECEEVIKGCFVNSQNINNKISTRIVKLYVEQCVIEKDLLNLWNNSMSEYKSNKIHEINSQVITNLEEYITKIDVIINWDNKVIKKITTAMKKIVFLNKVDWYNKKTYNKLENGVNAIRYISEYEDIKSYIGNIQKIMSKIKEFKEIVQALNKDDIVSLKQCYKKIERLKSVMPRIMEMEYILKSIKVDCPKLIHKLIEEEDRVNMLIKYKNFSVAWLWNQLNYMIKWEYNRFKAENINKEIEDELKKEHVLMRKLCVIKSWHNVILKVTEKKKRSLYSYKDAISRLGKVSNDNYDNYVNIAREELKNFKDIIPVWIMPVNEIIKNFTIKKLFDVLMIDEASNINIFIIAAMFRAKKAIIFGDDNQSNMTNIFYDNKIIKTLEKKYLMDIPNWQWFDMKTSIYSTALRTFPSVVKLTTNYRSLPEIVNFSNRLCYSNKILVCNENKEVNRFWMPIKAVKVEGVRDKYKHININEAKAIVAQIEKCCENPLYSGMTMGVISLLGDEQAQLINDLLKKSMKEKELHERKIICGTSGMFEGEERDIIFLSMVISNEVKFATLTKDADIRRFNVAVSRAKRQMWLFHSINLEDLNEECVRAKLLNYCINFKIINKNLRIA